MCQVSIIALLYAWTYPARASLEFMVNISRIFKINEHYNMFERENDSVLLCMFVCKKEKGETAHAYLHSKLQKSFYLK
jgi:hypothetical protein